MVLGSVNKSDHDELKKQDIDRHNYIKQIKNLKDFQQTEEEPVKKSK